MYFFVFLMTLFSAVFVQGDESEKVLEKKSIFFENLSSLLQTEQWENIVCLGEKELQGDLSSREKFSILDQLVSSYFRLGSFDRAKDKASELILIGESLDQPELIVDSLYKFSAALRGTADSEKDSEKKRDLFSDTHNVIEKAFVLLEEKCSANKALRAKVLFNRGAVHCDDPIGDVRLGIGYYEEAVSLFKELKEDDYTKRMQTRLGKAYLLIGELLKSRGVIEEIKQGTLEKRTLMHVLYLEAQLCLEELDVKKSLQAALEGKEIADFLQARRDMERFDALIEKISKSL